MPQALPSILSDLSAVEREVGDFFGSLDPADFVHRVGEAWTPAEQLDHLNIAVSAAARAFAVSPWLLQLRFGRSRRPSRSYEELREAYQARLARGGGASGRYVPQRDESGEDPLVRRTMLLSRWYRVNERLQSGIRTWKETGLDRARVPHPLLGRITMRELAFFTIYHGRHHIEAVKRRLPNDPRSAP